MHRPPFSRWIHTRTLIPKRLPAPAVSMDEAHFEALRPRLWRLEKQHTVRLARRDTSVSVEALGGGRSALRAEEQLSEWVSGFRSTMRELTLPAPLALRMGELARATPGVYVHNVQLEAAEARLSLFGDPLKLAELVSTGSGLAKGASAPLTQRLPTAMLQRAERRFGVWIGTRFPGEPVVYGPADRVARAVALLDQTRLAMVSLPETLPPHRLAQPGTETYAEGNCLWIVNPSQTHVASVSRIVDNWASRTTLEIPRRYAAAMLDAYEREPALWFQTGKTHFVTAETPEALRGVEALLTRLLTGTRVVRDVPFGRLAPLVVGGMGLLETTAVPLHQDPTVYLSVQTTTPYLSWFERVLVVVMSKDPKRAFGAAQVVEALRKKP